MKIICVVDTSSLIYLSGIKLANRSLHKWLWSEFDVRYSKAVHEEILRNRNKLDAAERRRKWNKYRWSSQNLDTCERLLFGRDLTRMIEAGVCRHCYQTIMTEQQFRPNLNDPKDRGERQNCCIALDAIIKGAYSQAIFLTDDFRAIRDYAVSLFDLLPLGTTWCSLDFIVYLFMRRRQRIPVDEALNALRDANAQSPQGTATQKSRRLTEYSEKVSQIDKILANILGGQ